MKKFLACALALTLTSAMFASCGSSDDSSSSKAEAKTTTTTTAATTTEATTTTAAPESTADSTAASGTESEGEAAKDISEMPATLKNYEEASVYFKKDMDVASIVEPFAEKDYENDESHVNLSVEELAGVPMLKVEVLDQDDQGNYKIPKIKFHMEKFFEGHEADLEKIFTIKADVVTKLASSLVTMEFLHLFLVTSWAHSLHSLQQVKVKTVGTTSMTSARLSGLLSGVPMSLQ